MSERAAPLQLSPRLVFGWGLGTLPVALFFNTFNALALRYLTDVVGLTAVIAGSLIVAGTFGPKVIAWAGGGSEGHQEMGVGIGISDIELPQPDRSCPGRASLEPVIITKRRSDVRQY